MQTEIKEIYSDLTGGKEIISENQIISSKNFSSISFDKFLTELRNRGVNWNGSDIEFKSLFLNANQNNYEHTKEIISSPSVYTKNISKNDGSCSVGIDIESILEFPVSLDYWEDNFYKSKFKPEEIAYCLKKNNPQESFAGIYSCKEALIKCDNSLKWDDILIGYGLNGKPKYQDYCISISHSNNFVISIAIKFDSNIEYPNLKKPNLIRQVETIKPKTTISIFIVYLLIFIIVAYLILRDIILK